MVPSLHISVNTLEHKACRMPLDTAALGLSVV
jgi:hypothetical protein